MRTRLGLKIVAWSYPQIGIVTTVKLEKPHKGRAVQHFLPAGPFAILPLPDDHACITWSEDAVRGAEIMALDAARFHEELALRFGHRLGDFEIAGPRASWPLGMHLARDLVAARVALVGDAAHGVHPIAGQGVNLALRDVAALTEVVTDAARLGLDIGGLDVLQRYERWRRTDSAMSAATFDALNRLFSSDWSVMRTLRGAGLGLVDRMPQLKQFFVNEAAGLTGDVPKLLRGEAV
jgi:2-octaprenyl-6-methoxyphenol hydroxylase